MLFFCTACFAQTKNDPLKILYDAGWQAIKSGTPAFTSLVWQEDGKWHKQDYYYPAEKLQMDGVYADKDFKIKDGFFTWYYPNGQVSEKCLFVNNKNQGEYVGFYEDGRRKVLCHYKDGIPVDSSRSWYASGSLYTLLVTDQQGNGTQTDFFETGKTRTKGNLVAGKRDGTWPAYNEDGKWLMTLTYKADSLLATNCVDDRGNPVAGNCIYEKPAEYIGGNDGWRRFLEHNLQYPAYAVRKKIEGVVRVQFMVDKSGNAYDFTILSSPHESLSKEVLRLMNLSPKWEPAIRLNKRVEYRHVQSVTFRLE